MLATDILMVKLDLGAKVKASSLRKKMNLPYAKLSSFIYNGVQWSSLSL